MSFEIECLGCGALSSPSIGTCPYCKSVITPSKKIAKESPQVTNFKKYYNDGKLAEALYLGKELWNESDKFKGNATFLTIFAKILFETEAYPSILNSVLAHANFLSNLPAELLEIKEIQQARPLLEKGKNDPGEILLRHILSRNPKSAYAHFILGTHLYFTDNEIRQAIIHLEAAVRHHPKFLRAWGCLGSIYKKLGKEQLAARAFKEAIKLENNVNMKKFFKNQL